MQSLHHSRARILFDAACAFGIAGSCVFAWMQTWATAMLAAAAIAALYGLARTSDMFGRSASVASPVAAAEPPSERVTEQAPVSAEAPPEGAAAPEKKRTRKPSKRSKAEPIIAETPPEPQIAPEPEPVLHVVASAPEEPEYVPATPLFETEPFVRQQRAAFGRKAR